MGGYLILNQLYQEGNGERSGFIDCVLMPDVSMELMKSMLPLLFITKCERPQLCGNICGWTVSMADFGPVDVVYAFEHVKMIQEGGLMERTP
jgi:hypothetical protein